MPGVPTPRWNVCTQNGNPGNDYKTEVCLVHLKTEPRCGPEKRDAGQLMTLASARKPAGTYLTHAGWVSLAPPCPPYITCPSLARALAPALQ